MKAVLLIFYSLAFYVHTLSAQKDRSYCVNALNHILSQPKWQSLTSKEGTAIILDGEPITANDFLATDSSGKVVNYTNLLYKIRQAHQFLSCHYAKKLTKYYDYTFSANGLCKDMEDFTEFLECSSTVWEIIGKIDKLEERMVGALSWLNQLYPEPFDQAMPDALNDIKSYYNNLNYNRESLDKSYHDEILQSNENEMEKVIELLVDYYDNNCGPVSYRKTHGGISGATDHVLRLETQYSPLTVVIAVKGIVYFTKGDSLLREFNEGTYGFKYDSGLEKIITTYDELMDESDEGDDDEDD